MTADFYIIGAINLATDPIVTAVDCNYKLWILLSYILSKMLKKGVPLAQKIISLRWKV